MLKMTIMAAAIALAISATADARSTGFDQQLENAQNGIAIDMVNVGRAYLYGTLVPQDIDRGILWLQKAASGDSAAAHLILAQYYERKGQKFAPDAQGHYRQAAILGDTGAQIQLADFIYRRLPDNSRPATLQSLHNVIRLFEHAGSGGESFAWYRLATIHREDGRVLDAGKAVVYFQRCSDSQVTRCSEVLGRWLLDDKHLARSTGLSGWTYMEKAARGGSADAQVMLAEHYRDGGDLETAGYWADMAQSDSPAARAMIQDLNNRREDQVLIEQAAIAAEKLATVNEDSATASAVEANKELLESLVARIEQLEAGQQTLQRDQSDAVGDLMDVVIDVDSRLAMLQNDRRPHSPSPGGTAELENILDSLDQLNSRVAAVENRPAPSSSAYSDEMVASLRSDVDALQKDVSSRAFDGPSVEAIAEVEKRLDSFEQTVSELKNPVAIAERETRLADIVHRLENVEGTLADVSVTQNTNQERLAMLERERQEQLKAIAKSPQDLAEELFADSVSDLRRGNKSGARGKLEEAVELGHLGSMHNLAMLLLDSSYTQSRADQRRAIELLQRASANGHADATESLGWAYMQGTGVGIDQDRARMYFDKAQDQRNDASQRVAQQ